MSIDSPPRHGRPRSASSAPAPAAARALAPGRSDHPAPPVPAPPRLPSRRSPRWIALGLVAVCLGGLLSWLVYADVAQQTSVITLTRTVHRGQTIEADTLSTAAISRSAAVSSVPATEISRLVGQTALVDLLEGTVLPHGAIGVTTVPAPGRAIVGLQLAYGRVPSGLLPPSTPVRLVSLPANNAQTPDQPQREQSSPPVTFFGRVVDYTDGTDGASVLVNVDVAADEASRVTVLAATDRLAILRDAE